MRLRQPTVPTAALAAAALVALAPAPAAAADPLCPAAADAGRIAAAFGAKPAPLPMMAAPKLGLTEAAVSAGAPAVSSSISKHSRRA